MATDICSIQAMFRGLCSLVPQVCAGDRKRRTAPSHSTMGNWEWDKRMGRMGDVKMHQAEQELTVLIKEHKGRADNLVPLDSLGRGEEACYCMGHVPNQCQLLINSDTCLFSCTRWEVC